MTDTRVIFCARCQQDTPHSYELDENGEHLLICTAPTLFVRQCTDCLPGGVHRVDDAGVEHHRIAEYHAAEANLPHEEGDRYTAPCRHFLKLPGHVTDIAPHLQAHRQANDRRGQPVPPCAHRFPEVAADHRESVCAGCGKTHREIFRYAD